PEAAPGIEPFDVQVGAADAAGAAFNAALVPHHDLGHFVFPLVDFGGAEAGAPLLLAFRQADVMVLDDEMGPVIGLEPVAVQFVLRSEERRVGKEYRWMVVAE